MTPLLILGIGNPILGDDGVGPRAIDELGRSGGLPPGTELLDGGTGGLALLPEIEDAERLIVIDAVDLGGTPGALHRFGTGQVPPSRARPLSPHEVGLHDLLAVARLCGRAPAEVVVIGVQIAGLSVGDALSPAVEAALPALLDAVRAEAHRLAARAEAVR